MKRVIPALTVVVLLFTLFACSKTSGHRANIPLPEDTTVSTAEEIIQIVWKDNFITQISNRFPNFNPMKNPSSQGISLKWFKFTPFDKNKKSKLSL